MSECRGLIQRLVNRISSHRAFAASYILVLFAAIILAFLASRNPYFSWDVPLARSIQSITSDLFYALMWGLSALGAWYLALLTPIACSVFLTINNQRLEGVFCSLTLTGALLNVAIKALVLRPRPGPDVLEIRWLSRDSSFPSGHVMYFVVFFGYLFFLVWTEMKPSLLRTTLLIAFGLLIALIGVSRVYLGSHWPSDALGGYLFGGLWLTLLITVYTTIKEYNYINT